MTTQTTVRFDFSPISRIDCRYRGDLTLLDTPCLMVSGGSQMSQAGKLFAKSIVLHAKHEGLTIFSIGTQGTGAYVAERASKHHVPFALITAGPLNTLPCKSIPFAYRRANLIIAPDKLADDTPLARVRARDNLIANIAPACIVTEALRDSQPVRLARVLNRNGAPVGAIHSHISDRFTIGPNQLIDEDIAIPLHEFSDFVNFIDDIKDITHDSSLMSEVARV